MTAHAAAAAYVATVAALTAYAFSSNEDHWPAEIAAAVLTLPLIVAALPIIYVVGGLAWHGPLWVVTLTFTAMMAAVACGNLLLAGVVGRRRATASRERRRT